MLCNSSVSSRGSNVPPNLRLLTNIVEEYEINKLLKRFPKIELSYETLTSDHKKVAEPYNIAMAIPQGRKYYAWFSYDIADDTLYIMELNKEKRIMKIKKQLHYIGVYWSLGTILYGVFINPPKPEMSPIFVIEDIIQYQGYPMKNMTFGEKLPFLNKLFKAFSDLPVECPNTCVKFRLPAIWNLKNIRQDPSLSEQMGECEVSIIPQKFRNLPYQVHHIQYRAFDEILPFLNYVINPSLSMKTKSDTHGKMHLSAVATTPCNSAVNKLFVSGEIMRFPPCYTKPQYRLPTIFHVCADIQYDIYHLFAYGKSKSLIYYDLAYIPNYKTSIFMNSLFRKIRENQNLDSIEESDDESDFQNDAEDKYVDLHKILAIECRFHSKFRRWVPQRVVKPPYHVVHVSKL